MAGAGFKTFTVGEVLTSSDVNTYLMQQAVMAFASSGARGSAIGTATEGMVSYLADTDAVEVYDGSAWVGVAAGGFTASTAITTTDASWTVPTLADPVVRVTVVGGGGAGGEYQNVDGNAGSASSFACSAGTATAAGGLGGDEGTSIGGTGAPHDGLVSGNGGNGGMADPAGDWNRGGDGNGGAITIAYFDMTGVTTANVTVGAGGSKNGGTYNSVGGDGVVIVEYRAG